jgi:hypothetical protein
LLSHQAWHSSIYVSASSRWIAGISGISGRRRGQELAEVLFLFQTSAMLADDPNPHSSRIGVFPPKVLRTAPEEQRLVDELTERVLAAHPAWSWPLIDAEARRLTAARLGAAMTGFREAGTFGDIDRTVPTPALNSFLASRRRSAYPAS